VVATAVPASEELPGELAEAVASLALLDDAALERAARGHLAAEAAERLEVLHLQQQRQGLTANEASELAGLLHQYERAMVVRAQAVALLRERGWDVSGLLARP
jgi:hypothetical protein